MITESALAFGRTVRHAGQAVEIVDILRRPGRPTRVQIKRPPPASPRAIWVPIGEIEQEEPERCP